MSSRYWAIPPEWLGETCFILAGGPSLRQVDVSALRNRRVIAINNSYLLAPWAEVLYFCDARWYKSHRSRIDEHFRGRWVVTICEEFPECRRVQNTGQLGLEEDPCGLRHGSNSGYQAINLAYHLGAKRIVLLGYDMQTKNGRVHWHDGHEHRNPDDATMQYSFLPCFPHLVTPLEQAGVEVVNATPASALKCWQEVSLETYL